METQSVGSVPSAAPRVGASVAASKLPGIRAAICHDMYSAHQGVEHDDMNVLSPGLGGASGLRLARELVTTFLAAQFDGGERYVETRLQMIEDIESECRPCLTRACSQAVGARPSSVWIDYLSRQLLKAESSREMMEEDAVVERHLESDRSSRRRLRKATRYDEQLREILETARRDPKEIFPQLSLERHLGCVDLLRGRSGTRERVSTVTCRGRSTRRSPHDRDGTIAQAEAPARTGSTKPNLYVKIPATGPGLGAIEEMIAPRQERSTSR